MPSVGLANRWDSALDVAARSGRSFGHMIHDGQSSPSLTRSFKATTCVEGCMRTGSEAVLSHVGSEAKFLRSGPGGAPATKEDERPRRRRKAPRPPPRSLMPPSAEMRRRPRRSDRAGPVASHGGMGVAAGRRGAPRPPRPPSLPPSAEVRLRRWRVRTAADTTSRRSEDAAPPSPTTAPSVAHNRVRGQARAGRWVLKPGARAKMPQDEHAFSLRACPPQLKRRRH